MDDATIKFLGKWVLAPIAACLVFYKIATDMWDAAGVWVIIIPAAIAAAVFYFWQRSTKRSAHPWE